MINLNPFRKIVTVNVTQENIDKGDVDSGYSYPIALALNTIINTNLVGFYVDTKKLLFSRNMRIDSSSRIPKVARDFIDDFDNEKPVKPITFQVAIRKDLIRKQ